VHASQFPNRSSRQLLTSPGSCLFLAAMLAYAPPVLAKTGNFLPILASFFIVIPALLLTPAIAIALGKQQRGQKAPWIVTSLILAVISFGSLWWATQKYELTVGSGWPVIYLWAVPGIFLWLAYWWRARSG
jgi:hypothetical protein